MEIKEEHKENLINNCISYLWEFWKNEEKQVIQENFKSLGFTKKDFEYYGINEIIKDKVEE